MDLGVRPGLVMVDAQPKYEVDCILHEYVTSSRRCLLVGFKKWDDSEAQ